MYDKTVRIRALELLAAGATVSDVSRRLEVSRAAIREWRDLGQAGVARTHGCFRCGAAPPEDASAYCELLGLYLGDGCISRAGGAYSLRISCDRQYPRLIANASDVVRLVRRDARVFHVPAPGAVVVQANWKHWPCLFPQHGPGRKHERAIRLQRWQSTVVDRHPQPLLRGLFHSDGCRVTNWTVRPLRDGPKRYEYPRYFFSNESEDIIGICAEALERIAVHWTMPRRNVLSVARREDVARLDTFIGPKS